MQKPHALPKALKLAVLIAGVLVFVASCLDPSARTPVTTTSSERPEPITRQASDSTFGKFSHGIDEHKQFECASCHRREGKKASELVFAGHDSCVGCHMNQFISPAAANDERARAMCAICHESIGSREPPMRAFPVSFKEGFNMRFSHAAHDNGAGRPAQGCAFCHSPAGAGQTIPSGIDTHNNCYTCHTPDTKIGSCNTCHQLAPYRRTLASQYNFRAIFRHGDHTARQGVNCNECHNVINGAAQGRQVTSITILQHLTTPGDNCLACHNGSRAFTGNDPLNITSCSRCHTGMTNIPLPNGTYPEEPQAPPDTPPSQNRER